MKKQVQTTGAPAAIGPYSQAIVSGSLVFCSGQIPLIPETMQMEAADVRVQTRRVLANLAAVLEAAGSDPSRILKTTVFLKDMNHFVAFNEEYQGFFQKWDVPAPARSTIEVARLPKDALVEIEAVAELK